MARYSRLSNGADLESDAEADSVALMQSQRKPRWKSHGSTEYVPMEDLDDEGRAVPEAATAQIAAEMKNSSRRLLVVVLGVVFVLIAGGVVGSAYRRAHPRDDPREEYLLRPLPRAELSNGTHSFNRTTLMISLDGMHPHYVSQMRTPRLHEFVKSGCAVPHMEPSFPTQTFPNHWTLVTGMYPINHGIIGNTFYDPELDLEFVNTDPQRSLNPAFWGGEPVWATAAKHGLASAVHMWPGSEADLKAGVPDYASKFNGSEPLAEKAAKIVSWLDAPHVPELMLAYVPTIDTVGHEVGISGSQLVAACMEVDAFVGTIIDALSERNLTDVVNLVVVSDHGMAPTSDDRLVFLDDVIANWDNHTTNRGWPLAGLRFKHESDIADAFASADAISFSDHTFRVFKSDDTPRRWRFTTAPLNSPDPKRPSGPGNDYNHPKKPPTSDDPDSEPEKRAASTDAGADPVYGKYKHRLAPLYVVPEVGYSLLTHDEYEKMGHKYFLAGVHGYDNKAPIMQALFAAHGPAFPSGRYASFSNIDVYSALCRSLGIPESKDSDGNFALRPLDSFKVREQYPGVDFPVTPMAGSTFEHF